jgi:hypothetical protein
MHIYIALSIIAYVIIACVVHGVGKATDIVFRLNSDEWIASACLWPFTIIVLGIMQISKLSTRATLNLKNRGKIPQAKVITR